MLRFLSLFSGHIGVVSRLFRYLSRLLVKVKNHHLLPFTRILLEFPKLIWFLVCEQFNSYETEVSFSHNIIKSEVGTLYR